MALEHDLTEARAVADQQQELRLVIGRLEEFATTVGDNLDQVEWETKRTIIRTLVKRVEIDVDEIRVIFRIGPEPSGPDSRTAVLPDRSRLVQAENRGDRISTTKSEWTRTNANGRRNGRSTSRLVAVP